MRTWVTYARLTSSKSLPERVRLAPSVDIGSITSVVIFGPFLVLVEAGKDKELFTGVRVDVTLQALGADRCAFGFASLM